MFQNDYITSCFVEVSVKLSESVFGITVKPHSIVVDKGLQMF